MKILHDLLATSIDYAGLFPPAGLDMRAAVRNYAMYLTSDHGWALGRFIAPVSRLAEFETEARQVQQRHAWRVSALTGADLRRDYSAIAEFNTRNKGLVVDTVELKAKSSAEVGAARTILPPSLTAFVEIPANADPSQLVRAIGEAGFRAKVRTGGTTPDAFPSSDALARFIHTCVGHHVPFKATAGLHHPIRARYRLTYEPDSPVGTMFGFFNMFIASAVARQGGTMDDIEAALEEQSPAAFSVADDSIRWRAFNISPSDITVLRAEVAMGFGSCSFTEPIDDLRTLRFL
jgi:hypothetical protein